MDHLLKIIIFYDSDFANHPDPHSGEEIVVLLRLRVCVNTQSFYDVKFFFPVVKVSLRLFFRLYTFEERIDIDYIVNL